MEHNTDIELLNPGSTYPIDQLPEGTKWVITLGELAVDGGEVVSTDEEFKLIKVSE
jgi:hypothetical protein